MKKLLIACALIFYPVIKTSACTMPLPAIQQKFFLEKAMNSESFSKELHKQLKENHMIEITGIEFSEGLMVKLSNGCSINVVLKFGRPRHPGLCPEYLGESARTLCE